MEDLKGKAFGRLVVIGPGVMVKNQARWLCRCECGVESYKRAATLKNGMTRSCGCLRREATKLRKTTHGMSSNDGVRAPEYKIWASMKNRCSDPKSQRWESYGGRGIRVCDRWIDSFENFYADMGRRPGPDYQIDREDNDGNYEPGNCRWVSRLTNANNKQDTRVIEFQGRSMSLTEWAREVGLDPHTLAYRLRAGWPVERALMEPSGELPPRKNRYSPRRLIEWNGQAKTMTEWSAETGIPTKLLSKRITNLDWTPERAFTTPVRDWRNAPPNPIAHR